MRVPGYSDSSTSIYDNLYTQRLLRTSISERAADWQGANLSFYSATSTIPAQVAAFNMYTAEWGADWPYNATTLVNFPHPISVARCGREIRDFRKDTMIPFVQDDGVSYGTIMTVDELMQDYYKQPASKDFMTDSLPPTWLPSPEPDSNTLLGIFPTWGAAECDSKYINNTSPYPASDLYADQYSERRRYCFRMFTCSISSFWTISQNSFTRMSGTPVAQTPQFLDTGFHKVSHGDPITMNMANIPSFNARNFTRIFQSYPHEPVLSAVFATALANITDILALRPNRDHPKDAPIYKFTVLQHGYGYNTSPLSVRLSLAVISIYCLVTIAYLIYILSTGRTSTAWNSAMELVLLALQSKRPAHLNNVSVGVESLKTYREPLGVRVNDKDELELVFANDRDLGTRELRKIVPNEAY